MGRDDWEGMPSPTPVIAPTPHLSLNYADYVETHFLRLAYGDQLTTIRGGGWATRAELSAAPGDVLAHASYFQNAHDEVLVRVGEALCHLILHDRSLAVRVAAHDHATVEQAMSCVRSALAPVEQEDREVPVRFWWMARNGSRQMARMLDAPSWADLRGNYGASTTARLERLSAWRGQPEGSGRLVLFHGAPGTGKTSAIRALASEWRSWAHFHFVTDPEAFLSDPSYLMTVIGGGRPSSAAARASESWRVVVLEDAGEFLALDAGQLNGRALSRLLNVGDGVLGQAIRVLILITTNERLSSLHPALTRAGRCLADIEFLEFDRVEIAAWCAVHDIAVPGVSSASLADLYALQAGHDLADERPQFGFRAA